MAFEYKQNTRYDAAVNPATCKASVSGGRGMIYQCGRKRWKDGWCKQHHPDSEAERRRHSVEKYEQKWRNREKAEEQNAVALLRELGYTVTPPTPCKKD